MDDYSLGRIRRARGPVRVVASIVTASFFSLICHPTALALQSAPDQTVVEQHAVTNTARLAKTNQDLSAQLDRAANAMASGQDISADLESIRRLQRTLVDLDGAARAEFAAIEARLQARHIPAVILQRHADAVDTYQREVAVLLQRLRAIDAATDVEQRKLKIKAAREHLRAKKHKRAPHPFDPEQLPHKSMRANPNNTPRLNKDDYTRAGLHDTPYRTLAAHGDFTFDALPGADDPAYLAASIEVPLSAAVQAKAAELDHNPVKIYHWVLNNVEWLPTWGAMQNAELILASRRGNAFDIAGLLIALLRASGIPARYVHGTIEVSADAFSNWAGGFSSAAAAADFAASGGIPITAAVSGGRIDAMRMEHIWVEAAIDFHPARGAVNRVADSWVALDPSYKQYEYLPGLDAIAISGLDPEALAQSFVHSGTINPAEGWVADLDAGLLQAAQTQTQAALTQYISAQLTDPTVGEVIGGRNIIVRQSPVLPSALPYRTLVNGPHYAAVPDTLRHAVAFAFDTDRAGALVGGKRFPWPQINNRKVTLSFRPATAADEQALAALLPEGEITDVAQLPSTLPGYLINVIPELSIDGAVVLQGGAMSLGEELPFAFSVTMPGHGTSVHRSPVVAGSYLAIAVIGGTVSPEQLAALQTRTEHTRAILQSGDAAAIAALTREALLGDLFYAGTLGYFAEYLALARIAAQQQGGHFNLAPSVGTYGYEPEVDYFFGIPRALRTGGVVMDLDRVAAITGTAEGDAGKRLNLVFQNGILSSALEHAVPEQMFTTPDAPAEAVSAVKALAKASGEGQRIYHITRANQSATLPNIHHDQNTLDEIQTALAVGKEVITHTDSISVPGWTGAGYIIFDPITGDGAYKIGGGANGGWLVILGFASIFVIALAPIVIVGLGPLAIASAAFAMKQAIDFDTKLKELVNLDSPEAQRKAVNELVFLLTLEAVGTAFFPLMITKTNSIERIGWEAFDAIIMLLGFSMLDMAFGVGS